MGRNLYELYYQIIEIKRFNDQCNIRRNPCDCESFYQVCAFHINQRREYNNPIKIYCVESNDSISRNIVENNE